MAGVTYLIAQHGTSLYGVTWDGTSAIASFGTAIKTGLTASSKLRSAVWKDSILFTNGVDNPFKWDGTTVADIGGSPPKSHIIKIYASRAWLVDAANPNQVRYSDLENFDSWPALNVILVRDSDGDFITGLSPQSGGLVIFKNNSVQSLYGSNRQNFRLDDPFSWSVGAVGYDAVLDDGIFMAKDNWYQFSLSNYENVPETHTPYLDALTTTQKSAGFSAAQGSEGRYYFLAGTDIVVFDSKYRGATSWDDLNAQCFLVADSEGFAGDLLVGDATAGIVYKLTGSDDAGTGIETIVKTGYTDQGTEQDKVWRYFLPDIDIIVSTAVADFSYTFDIDYQDMVGSQTRNVSRGEDFLVWDTGTWDNFDWGDTTNYTRSSDPFWLHNARGRYVSHSIRAVDRIRFKGYSAKYMVVGRI